MALLFNENSIDLLRALCEGDDCVKNDLDNETTADDMAEVLSHIPEVDEDDAAVMPQSVNVENVRIYNVNSNYYIELSELVKLAESEKCDIADAYDSVFSHYEDQIPDQDHFFITIPDKDMNQTIKEATEGNPHALHAIRDGSTLLRNVINKGLPLRRLKDVE